MSSNKMIWALARTSVAFSEFLFEVKEGHVDEIHHANRKYTFRRKGNDGSHTAIGPDADPAQLKQLRPTDPALPDPKLVIE